MPRHRGGGHTGRTSSPPASRATTARAARPSRRRACGSTASRTSRAATSTRCSRRTSRTSATTPGGRTCSWGGTDARRGTGPDRSSSRDPGRRPRPPRGRSGPTATPRTWSAGRCATLLGRARRRTGTCDRRRCPSSTGELFPGAVYENKFGTVAVRSRDRAVGDVEITTFRSDHDYADYRRPHRVEFSDSIELDLARRDFTVNAMAWGAEPGSRAAARRPVRRPGRPRGAHAPGRRRPRDAVRARTRCAWSGRSGWRRRSTSRSSPPRSPRSSRAPSSSAHLSGERIAAEMRRAARRRPCRRSGSGCSPTPASSLTSHPSWRRSGACPRTRSRARTCGTTRCAPSTALCRSRHASGWRPCCTTSASRRRWRTAGSSATRSSVPSRRRRGARSLALAAPPSGSASSISSATTCSGTCRPGPTLRSVGSS